MLRATLIVNPRAGARRDLPKLLAEMSGLLRGNGIAADWLPTTSPGTAGQLASQAIAAGSDAIFACGGDGTVHEVLQGVVGTSACMGVIPMGTANALARNLGLSSDPLQALAQQMKATAQRVPVGEVIQGCANFLPGQTEATLPEPRRRYFTVMAGAGPDGALVYSLLSGQKSAMGRAAYYVHAARLYVTHPFQPFRIRFRPASSANWQEDVAISAMSARIGDLGGLLGRLTRGSSLRSTTLRLSYLRGPASISLPSWFVSGLFSVHQINPWLKQIEVDEFECLPMTDDHSVHAEADGEWIGRIPLSVRIVPGALYLLCP